MVTSNLLRWQVARRLAKEKMPGRIPTLPLFQSLRLRKPIAISFALWCIVMPNDGGGGFRWGGMGRVESMKWWCGDDDEMIDFLHSFYILSRRSWSRRASPSYRRDEEVAAGWRGHLPDDPLSTSLSPHRSEVQIGIIFMDKILKEDGSRKVLLTYLYTCWLILLITPGPYRALWGMARSVSSCSSAVRITCLFDKVLIGEFRSSYVYRRISSFSTVFNLEV